MRIMFFCDQYPPVIWDGAGTYTRDASQALARAGHEVHVLCCQGRRIRNEELAGVFVHRRPLLLLPVSRLLGPFGSLLAGRDYPRDSLTLRASLAISYAFWFRILGVEPDVVETEDGETRALLIALRHSVPLVVNHHTPTLFDLRLSRQIRLKGRLADTIDRLSSDRADTTTAPSELMVDALRPLGWLKGQSPLIIPNPFSGEAWTSTTPAETTAPLVLFVGRLEHRKGIDTLLSAVALLTPRVPGLKLMLVGRTSGLIDHAPAGAWLEERLQRLDVPNEYLGHVGHDRLPTLLAQARVIAVPSRFESFSMVALEALALGRPVVTSTRTGIAPFVERWGAGIAVPPEQPQLLASALETYLLDPLAAASAGERGRRGVANELDPDVIAAQRVAAYERAIAVHSSR